MASSLFPTGAAPAATPTASKPQINMAAIGHLKQMMGMVNTLKNPMQALQVLSGQVPVLGQVLQLVHGRNPKDVFCEECKKVGMDPNSAMQLIQQLLS